MHKRRLLWLLAALLALKFALIVLDGNPSVFLGDSGSYLFTALHGYIPPDRGFVYGFLLRPLAVWPHSLRFLVFAQGAMSAVTAWLIAVNLTRYFAVPFRWAAFLSVVCALEPLQLISERYVMTDTAALFVFAVLTTLTISVCRDGSTTRLLLALAVGTFLISIRISYLPIVLINSVLLPLRWIYLRRAEKPSRLVTLLLLWLGTGQLMLYGYQCLNASVSGHAKPGYFYMDGFILAADVAPIVTDSDFPRGLDGHGILFRVGPALTDPISREGQIFAPDGLANSIRRTVKDEYEANRVAKSTALHAMWAHPTEFAGLVYYTWSEFFQPGLLQAYLRIDEGGIKATDGPLREEIRERLSTDLAMQTSTGPVWRWHRAAVPWYWFLVTAPLAVPFLFWWFWPRISFAGMLIPAYLLILFAQTILFATHAIPRYLMPSAWLMFLAFGVLAQAMPPSRMNDAPETARAPSD